MINESTLLISTPKYKTNECLMNNSRIIKDIDLRFSTFNNRQSKLHLYQ